MTMDTPDSRDIDHTERIPPEILAEIFLFTNDAVFTKVAVFTNDAEFTNDAGVVEPGGPDNPPWLFGQICCRWRAVALSTPELWCYLTPVVSILQHLPPSAILPVLSAYLERSGQLPLTLTVNGLWPQALIAPLLSQSNRWGHVNISSLVLTKGRAGAHQSILTTLANSDLTCLQTLRLQTCRGHVQENGSPFSIVLPRLRSLRASSTTLLKHLSIPHLESLDFRFIGVSESTLDHFRSFLGKCASSLTRLTLRSNRTPDVDLINFLKILPNLTSLHLHRGALPGINDILIRGLHSQSTVPCVVPKLRSLVLRGNVCRSDDDLVDMLRSRCQENQTSCDLLLSVQLYRQRPFVVQVWKQLMSMSTRGLDVDVFEQKGQEWVRMDHGEGKRR
ncbi:hypothetical protein MVEN_01208400 [Mycena venus]|uniref:F-box domain-containing protein n=1 Tax=Mycena venus TaxID=2733690 RepID=A0A8H7CYT9_9AGAR|nr:hypothetical protein MVEN_01208400 [Mycena venus]